MMGDWRDAYMDYIVAVVHTAAVVGNIVVVVVAVVVVVVVVVGVGIVIVVKCAVAVDIEQREHCVEVGEGVENYVVDAAAAAVVVVA